MNEDNFLSRVLKGSLAWRFLMSHSILCFYKMMTQRKPNSNSTSWRLFFCLDGNGWEATFREETMLMSLHLRSALTVLSILYLYCLQLYRLSRPGTFNPILQMGKLIFRRSSWFSKLEFNYRQTWNLFPSMMFFNGPSSLLAPGQTWKNLNISMMPASMTGNT